MCTRTQLTWCMYRFEPPPESRTKSSGSGLVHFCNTVAEKHYWLQASSAVGACSICLSLSSLLLLWHLMTMIRSRSCPWLAWDRHYHSPVAIEENAHTHTCPRLALVQEWLCACFRLFLFGTRLLPSLSCVCEFSANTKSSKNEKEPEERWEYECVVSFSHSLNSLGVRFSLKSEIYSHSLCVCERAVEKTEIVEGAADNADCYCCSKRERERENFEIMSQLCTTIAANTQSESANLAPGIDTFSIRH